MQPIAMQCLLNGKIFRDATLVLEEGLNPFVDRRMLKHFPNTPEFIAFHSEWEKKIDDHRKRLKKTKDDLAKARTKFKKEGNPIKKQKAERFVRHKENELSNRQKKLANAIE